jgi:hypothetical protein
MQTASWVFVSLLIVFLGGIVGYREVAPARRPLDSNTHMILGILCALLAGLAAFFMTGDFAVQITGQQIGLGTQAAGGAGLFVFVLWWWRSFPLLPTQAISGQGSPVASIATAFHYIDELYPEVKAVIRRQAQESASPYSVTSKFEGGALIFVRKGQPGERDIKIEQIGPDDFKNLPPEDAEYLQTLDKSLTATYKQWVKLYPKRISDPSIEAQLHRLARSICKDLEAIFKHLGNKRYVLEDHYGAMRSICRELENGPLI